LEEPLAASKVARARHQSCLLSEPADHDSKPSMALISHVGAHYTARDRSLMRVSPPDAPRTNVSAKFDETLSGKLVEVEL
jgi:hypothetical protein